MRKVLYLLPALCLAFVAACGPSQPIPDRQEKFVRIIQDGMRGYVNANREELVQKAITTRDASFAAFVAENAAFTDWVLKIDKIEVKDVEVNGATVKAVTFFKGTMDDGSLEIAPNAYIVAGTPLFDAMSPLKSGGAVVVSGKFLLNAEGKIAMNPKDLADQKASMKDPEFLVAFDSVKVAK